MARTPYSLNSYTGGATAATIVATGIGAADTTITITGLQSSNWSPLGTAGGFYLGLDYGLQTEEKIYVPSGSWTYSNTGVTLSGITRGIDGTTAQIHGTVGFVTPVITSIDENESNVISSIFLGGNPTAVSGFNVGGTVNYENNVISSGNYTYGINQVTAATYSGVLRDVSNLVIMSGTANTQLFYIPINSQTAYPVGTQLNIVRTTASGVTISGTAGVTVFSTGATASQPKLRAQYSAATVIQAFTNVWYVNGDIA